MKTLIKDNIKYLLFNNLSAYDSHYDLFLAVNAAIKDLAGFVSLINFDYPSSPNTNKEVRAILEFYYGVMTC